MSSRDQTKRARKKPKASTSEQGEWRPWGLYDDRDIPELSKDAIREAATQLNLSEEAKILELHDRLRSVAIMYWRYKRDITKPGPKWFRQQVEPIKEATEKLYKLIHDHPGGIGLTSLTQLTQLRMNRPLRGRIPSTSVDHQSESFERLLERFAKVCNEYLKKKGTPGAKKQKHIHYATEALVELWQEFTGRQVPLSLDTEVGRVMEFTYPAPRFVHFVLQTLDPDIDLANTATALREVLGTRRMDDLGSS
jgi:hypothetical protein